MRSIVLEVELLAGSRDAGRAPRRRGDPSGCRPPGASPSKEIEPPPLFREPPLRIRPSRRPGSPCLPFLAAAAVLTEVVGAGVDVVVRWPALEHAVAQPRPTGCDFFDKGNAGVRAIVAACVAVYARRRVSGDRKSVV